MNDGNRLEGKVALITGVAGDIGAATAKLMVSRGAKVMGVDVPGASLGSLRESLGDDFQTVEGDVTDERAVQDYVAQTRRRFGGRIDIFFNNAGIEGPVKPMHEYTLAEFKAVFAVNVEGVFLGLRHVLPVMLEQNAGSIINSSSLGGLGGAPGMAGYNASKHAVLGLTRVAAVEVARQGVRVNCINPGPIRGRMISSIDGGAGTAGASRVDAVPAGRYGEPWEVAALVAFLASDDAAYITGAFHTVDGGRFGRI